MKEESDGAVRLTDEPFLMIDYTLSGSCTTATGGAGPCERWAHQNRLGSVVAVTESGGSVVERYRYSPYGESGPEGDGGFPFRFTGQKLHAAIGLYHYKARFYDPEVGRFLQADPIGYEDQMNLYAYVGNDPVNHWDPTGQYCNALNRGSGFCARSQRFATIDADPRVNSRTTFFAAASLTTEVLGSLDGPGGNEVSGRSVANYLRTASASFEKQTTAIANAIRNNDFLSRGSLSENDSLLVRVEQDLVQQSLDNLKATDEALYDRVIASANSSLNSGPGSDFDKNYNRVLDQVRNDLGRNIDFANKSDRIAIGDGLTAAIREDRNVTCTGSRIQRTSC